MVRHSLRLTLLLLTLLSGRRLEHPIYHPLQTTGLPKLYRCGPSDGSVQECGHLLLCSHFWCWARSSSLQGMHNLHGYGLNVHFFQSLETLRMGRLLRRCSHKLWLANRFLLLDITGTKDFMRRTAYGSNGTILWFYIKLRCNEYEILSAQCQTNYNASPMNRL